MRIVKRIAKPRIKEFSHSCFYTPELIECVKETEIIKALNCLKGYEVLCDGCLYQMRGYVKCRENVASDALDLINRQKAEIERLQTEKDNLIKTYKECMTEAIKEFAERLKADKFAHKNFGELVAVEDIDNLVNEMVGEQE